MLCEPRPVSAVQPMHGKDLSLAVYSGVVACKLEGLQQT
jgi:hypothetical protein